MPGYDLGTARGIIEMQYNGKGVKEAEDDIGGLQKKTGSASGVMKKASTGMLVGGAAIAAGFALAINAAATFEQKMSGVAAVSGASDKQMDALRGKALQLGKDTQFSASEAASGIEELVKAGVSVPDVLNGAADAVTNLAAAGGIDLATSATIASNAMNSFNIPASKMNGVVDAIAGAANASAIDVGQFGESLSQVGAVAHLTGASFDDTATAIALMGNAGIKGSDAGTSLKTMLMRLQPVTKKATDEFEKLGLITQDGNNKFYDSQGRLKSLSQVSGILQSSLKGMTKQQKQAALQVLFGSDAIRGAAVLADKGAKGFDKMSGSMKKVSAADVAKKRMDNLNGSMEQFKGSLETAGIVIGTAFLPMLTDVVDFVTKLVNAFLSLSDTQRAWIIGVIAAIGTLLLIVGAFIKIVLFIQKFVIALNILKLAFAETWVAALGPIGLIIVAIVAVIAIFVVLYKKVGWFRKGVDAAFGFIMKGVDALGDAFRWLWNNAIQPVLQFIIHGIAILLEMWAKMLGVLGKVPGFGWAKTASEAMHGAAIKAQELANNIKDIPDHKDVHINVITTHMGRPGPTNPDLITGKPKATGGVIKHRKGGTLIRAGEAGEDEAVVPLDGGVGMAVARLLGMMGAAHELATAAGPRPSGFATPAVGASPKPQRRGRGGDSRMSRIVAGELTLSDSGRAYIRGVAQDNDDAEDDYTDTISRMGRR